MNKVAILLVCVAYFAAVAIAQPRISEVFEARVTYEIQDKEHPKPYIGRGVFAADQAKGYGLEISTFEEHNNKYEIYRLERYDMGMAFRVDNQNRTFCNKTKLSGQAPAHWSWLTHAAFKGKITVRGRSLDLWALSQGYATIELMVDPAKPDVPVIVRRNSTAANFTIYYEEFNTNPNTNMFDVPASCKSALLTSIVDEPVHSKNLQCRARNEMIAVANAWWDAKVPYDTNGRHDGYREDCSGFVSACWALAQPGPSTEGFPGLSHPIAKDDLQPGDCLLFAAEHVVLFAGWVDNSKTQYLAFEETHPGEGMAKRPTPYPYWYSQSSFIPHRYNEVC